ncbi:hypothetical protein [Williamsia sterculiae]|uniref:hypothetical protein n=1 Tax=Williamsia sterculiae TaxID=1344003 RepID=UPI00117D943D|nr:hypothetical protein [Williamsia sterculiae]
MKLDNRRVYLHAGVLKIRKAGVRIDGNGATVQATSTQTSSVQVLADDVSISNLKLIGPRSTTRRDGIDQQALAILGAKRTSITGTSVDGSAAAGVFIGNGSSGFSLNDVQVRNTRADGIHITGGANTGKLSQVTTVNTGDDGVAVVSYGDAPACHDIVVVSPTVRGTTGGRGVAVVGGQRIQISDVDISDTSAAGVYVATEPAYDTRSVNQVSVVGGSVTRANRNPSVVNGAVLVYSGQPGTSTESVTISDLSISQTPASAQRAVGLVVDAGTVSNVTFSRLTLTNQSVRPFVSTARPGAYRADDWTSNNRPLSVN